MEPPQKPVALVTGARKGIGSYLAEQLVRRGYLVVGCSRGPADWSLEGYEHVLADVAQEAQVRDLLDHIRRTYGRLNATINNAGVASMNHSLLVPGETVDRIMSVNFRGTFLVSRESAKVMLKRKFGRIVNLTSIAVRLGIPGEAIYAASKSAVETLTRIMSYELADYGITVNAIGPTPIETGLLRNVPEESIQAILNRLAIKRRTELRDIMNVIDFFLRPESDYITGQVIYLGGA